MVIKVFVNMFLSFVIFKLYKINTILWSLLDLTSFFKNYVNTTIIPFTTIAFHCGDDYFTNSVSVFNN